MKLLVAFLVIVIFSSGCLKRDCDDDELTLQRKDYTGTELRTNGYYYSAGGKPANSHSVFLYYLFRNGVLYTFGDIDDTLAENGTVQSNLQPFLGNRQDWGIFLISGSKIEFQEWKPAPLGACFPLYKQKGSIINDSTFIITETIRQGSSKDDVNYTYKFHSFSQKPDSTNPFIQ